MALKAVLVALALLVAWMTLFRPSGGRASAGRGRGQVARERPPQPPEAAQSRAQSRAQDLEPCPRCGVFHVRGGTCDCDRGSKSTE